MLSLRKGIELCNDINNMEKELLDKRNLTIDKFKDLDISELFTKDYDELKKVCSIIVNYCSAKDLKIINELLKKKKEERYPEILDAHYYPEIKEMIWLNKETRRRLDRKILTHKITNEELIQLGEKTINFLIDKEIIKKYYVLDCGCEISNGGRKYLDSRYVDGLKQYWAKEKNTKEEDEKYHFGIIELYCENENKVIEISNIDEFEKYLFYTLIKVIKKADCTLDYL